MHTLEMSSSTYLGQERGYTVVAIEKWQDGPSLSEYYANFNREKVVVEA